MGRSGVVTRVDGRGCGCEAGAGVQGAGAGAAKVGYRRGAGVGAPAAVDRWGAGQRRAADGPAVAWVSLDERANEPARFWTYVIALRAWSTAAGSPLGLLAPPRPSIEAVLVSLVKHPDAVPGGIAAR